MKLLKIIILAIFLLIAISLISTAIEINYCHSWTTTPPLEFMMDDTYIKTGYLCTINSYIAIPGIALYLIWEAIF